MPEAPGNPMCPVASFERYISKLNPKCDRLWQHPLGSYQDKDTTWYANRPVGRNYLQKFMKDLSTKCKLSQAYTNHSVRVTEATILNQCQFSTSQIMAVTGHKSVSSLAIYQRVSDGEKLDMGLAISSAMGVSSDAEQPTSSGNLGSSSGNLPVSVTPHSGGLLVPSVPMPSATGSAGSAAFSNLGLSTNSEFTTDQSEEQAHLEGIDIEELFTTFGSGETISSNYRSVTKISSLKQAPIQMSHCTIANINIVIRK